jgi:hypothetical protein
MSSKVVFFIFLTMREVFSIFLMKTLIYLMYYLAWRGRAANSFSDPNIIGCSGQGDAEAGGLPDRNSWLPALHHIDIDENRRISTVFLYSIILEILLHSSLTSGN